MEQIGMLRRGALIGSIALSLALSLSAAVAFTPEPVPQAPSQGPAQPSAKATDEAAKLTDPFGASKPKGTEVTIPGIGSVGTLPKLDFGLELLYSPQSSPSSPGAGGVQLDPRAPENNMEIKGSLTHKF